jgi:Uncharacterized conserved protein (DUF2203)
MTRGEPQLKRVFSYAEAVGLLPEVQRVTDDAYRRVDALGPWPGAAAEPVIAEWAESLMALGLEIKGLWLVDFDNGSGYYCWRYPEPALRFFHSYEDGFGGRMPIQ